MTLILPKIPGIICRRASIQDYPGVLKLSGNQYGGRDVIPAMFFKYLDDPKRFSFVAECKGIIIAYNVLYIIDGNSTCYGEAARCHEDYRGQFFSFYNRSTFEFVVLMVPTINKIRGCSTNVEHWSSAKELKRNKHLFKRRIEQISYKDSLQSILNAIARAQQLDGDHPVCIENVDEDKLSYMIRDPESRKCLFPHGFIVRHNESFEAIRENIKDVLNHFTVETFATKEPNKSCFSSLSFGSVTEVSSSLLYDIGYHGLADFNLLKYHVVAHLKKLPKYLILEKPFMFHLFVNSDHFSSEDIYRLKKFCIKELQLNDGNISTTEQLHMDHYTVDLPKLKDKLFGSFACKL